MCTKHLHRNQMVRKQRSKQVISIPRAIFKRVIKSLMEPQHTKIKWFKGAIDALQMDSEEFVVERFEQAQHMCELFDSKTIKAKHFLPKIRQVPVLIEE